MNVVSGAIVMPSVSLVIRKHEEAPVKHTEQVEISQLALYVRFFLS